MGNQNKFLEIIIEWDRWTFGFGWRKIDGLEISVCIPVVAFSFSFKPQP